MLLALNVILWVSVVLLNLPDIELKDAQRFFAQKFSCGASVTPEDEIIIQGDFTDDIIDVIQEKWPEVGACLYTYIELFVQFGTFTFRHLANAFIQSDFQYVHSSEETLSTFKSGAKTNAIKFVCDGRMADHF